MELLEQCQKWHECDEYQTIIDTLEKLPEEERTPETDSELARAYNNLADPSEPEGIDMLKRAIGLLKPHENYFEGDYSWNFRMGYAYYYLDQAGLALHYVEKALEARPGDEDSVKLIDDCHRRLLLPQFQENFCERTVKAWKAFEEREAELRRLMDEDTHRKQGKELIAQCDEILHIAFEDICYVIGFNGQKYELTLTPEGDKVKLFELVYFQKHTPKEVLNHWNIWVGRQPMENIGLRADGREISGDDVQLWVERLGENRFALSAYCEKLLPMLREDENRVWWMLTTLTDQVLGEIPHMRYISSFDVLEAPKEGPSIRLSRLSDKLRGMGLDLSTDPEAYLESYTSYRLEPDEDPDADWRLDTIIGSTCCPPLLNDYLNGESGYMDDLHADGIVAGFFRYPLDGFTGEDRSQQIFDFRDKLEEALAGANGPEVLTLIGGATGLYCGYVDFIAWDLFAALDMAKEFFDDTDIPWASFHVFRRDMGTVHLKKPEDERSESEGRGDQPEDGEESEHDSKGTFAGFVLMSRGTWDKEQLIRDLAEKWDITVEEADGDEDDDALVFEVGNQMAAISLCPFPVPNGEAEENAEQNYMWPDAVKAAKEHKAHLIVAVVSKGEDDLLERGKLYTKLVAACCRQRYATGVYTSGVVFEPRFYEGFANMMREDELPIFNWIWFGLYRSEGGMCAYTYGMDVFGKDEMEVLNADANPNDLRNFLAGLAAYVLEADVTLNDGETIGFSADDKHAITRSEGVAILDQMTLKISYEPNEGEGGDGADCHDFVMDDGACHWESVEEKGLSVHEICVYNHMAIYLRWCMTHDLMNEEFVEEYGDLIRDMKRDPTCTDLRPLLLQENLAGRLTLSLFNEEGRAFARYYYGDGSAPYYPNDVDDYALHYFGPERYYSDVFQGEAYLFIPFDEEYYQAMAEVIGRRFANWKGQEFDEETLEPSPLAQAMMDYLGCECAYFPSMRNDDPILAAYSYARRDGVQEGFVPMLIAVDDILWECLILNSDPDSNNGDPLAFDAERVASYRKAMLAQPLKDGRALLAELVENRREAFQDSGMDWEEVLGEMEGGYGNNHLIGYWNQSTDMTHPLILANIPVKHPWEVFAWLPFGGWNDCPDTPELMAVASCWYEQYGAVPGTVTHDVLEFALPAPISIEKAMDVALEQYGFCPDIVDQGMEDATVGSLADTLWQSDKWYFWWD